MASLFSLSVMLQKALVNVVGGKVPEVAKSQMTRQRPLTTVFYALNILDVFSVVYHVPHTHTHTGCLFCIYVRFCCPVVFAGA